ncbi:hypothetical protein ILUMI_21760 [Ignelater luminosus]|uniref:Reverse transcriptase domain-containing protein n=1 Tax=Ignelater luminosus TaxID=2038154 RepID=A0A8K0CFS1_IGNLU|nr:hypothetical protein ILUMI_21760 [Ignelater luminosus]
MGFVVLDEQDSNYMIRKLHEQYNNWGLDINLDKTEQLTIGRDEDNMCCQMIKITMKMKKLIYSTIIESIVTYASKTLKVNKKNENRSKALEMNFWRRLCGLLRLEHVRNDEIQNRVHRSKYITDTINMKRLIKNT